MCVCRSYAGGRIQNTWTFLICGNGITLEAVEFSWATKNVMLSKIYVSIYTHMYIYMYLRPLN